MAEEGSGAGGRAFQVPLAGHRERFLRRFGGGGEVRLFFSPGRVNLMGAHLDYNGGPVMPMAIDRGTFFALRAREDRRVQFASTLNDSILDSSVDELPLERSGRWFDYPLGVMHAMQGRGHIGAGADVLIGGDLPIGAGLSSSASICVGTGFALAALWGIESEPQDLIRDALRAEREFVGVKCGVMDPYAVTLTRQGHLLWLDCSDESYEHVPIDPREVTIAVADTGVRRELARGAFNERVMQCSRAFEELSQHQPEARGLADISLEVLDERAPLLDAVIQKRARHVVAETARTHDARAALLEGDLERFGRNMSAAHVSLRDLFEVSVPELDELVSAALDWEGVLGTRLTGAGFGGCIVIALRSTQRAGFREHLIERYRSRFDSDPTVEFFRGGSGPKELT